MSCPINEILPNLFISDSITHTTNNFYSKFNIKLIINCSKHLPDIDSSIKNIKYIRIPITEEPTQNNINIINNQINNICDQINKFLINLSGVLIYCSSATQCSPSIIACYLIKFCGISNPNLAIYYIRTKRPTCFIPRINFYECLNYVNNNLNN